MIGPILKGIRKDKNIPIRFICDGIMDPGNYWRLENGKIESSFSTVLLLLERMNTSIEEFAEDVYIDKSHYKTYEAQLVSFFKNKNAEKLQQLKEEIANDKQFTQSLKFTHLYHLTNIYIEKIEDDWDATSSKSEIRNYLAKCNNWNAYELTLLNNVLFIYDLDISFLFYKTAVSKFSEINKEKMIPLTLNVMALCIQSNDNEKVTYLLSVLNQIELNEKSTYEFMIRKWGIAIGQYYLLEDEEYLLSAKLIVDIFRYIGMEDTYQLYQSWTNSYQSMIDPI